MKCLKPAELDAPEKDLKKVIEGRPTVFEQHKQYLVLADELGNITIIDGPKAEVSSHITKI